MWYIPQPTRTCFFVGCRVPIKSILRSIIRKVGFDSLRYIPRLTRLRFIDVLKA